MPLYPMTILFKLLPKDEEATIPHEVVGLVIKKRNKFIKGLGESTWVLPRRRFKTGRDNQAALSQMEKSNNDLRTKTLESCAALGLSVGQSQD